MTPAQPMDLDQIMKSDSRVNLCSFLTDNPLLKSFADPYGRTFLMGCILQGKTNLALEMIEKSEDLTKKSNSQKTVLHYAAIQGNAVVLKALMQKPALASHIHDRDEQKKSALDYAIEVDSLDAVKVFDKSAFSYLTSSQIFSVVNSPKCAVAVLSQLNRLDITDENKNTLLHRAVEKNNQELVLWLSSRITIDACNQNGETALSLACVLGFNQLAETLLDQKANPNIGASTPLIHIYLRDGDCNLARKLLTKNANPRSEIGGISLQEFAQKIGDTSFSDHLTSFFSRSQKVENHGPEKIRQFSSIIDAAKNATLKEFETLLHTSIDITQKDAEKNNALHIAVKTGNKSVACFLIAIFGQMFVDDVNVNQKTPAHIACENGDLVSLKRLLPIMKRIGPDIRGNTLFHVLSHAVETSEETFCAIIEQLLEAKLDINALNLEKKSALHHAAECGNMALFSALIKKGANPNASKDLNNDLFATLVRKKQFDACREALQSGLLRHTKCGTTTPLVIACQSAPFSVVWDLLDDGIKASKPADPNFIRTTKSPLLAATERYCTNSSDQDSETIFLHLLRSKVNLDKSISKGKDRKITALTYACQARHSKAVEYLLKFGAKVDKRAKGCHSPLSIACKNEDVSIVRTLVQHGAKPTTEMKKRLNQYSNEIQQLLQPQPEKKAEKKEKRGFNLWFSKPEKPVRRKNLSLAIDAITLKADDTSPEQSEMSRSCSFASSLGSSFAPSIEHSPSHTPPNNRSTQSTPVDPNTLEKRLQLLKMQ